MTIKLPTDFADKIYIDEAINKIDTQNDLLDAFAYGMQSLYASQIEEHIDHILSTKVFPKIWGKPNKFSFWWRRIEIERIRSTSYKDRVIIKQFGKVISDKLIKFSF